MAQKKVLETKIVFDALFDNRRSELLHVYCIVCKDFGCLEITRAGYIHCQECGAYSTAKEYEEVKT